MSVEEDAKRALAAGTAEYTRLKHGLPHLYGFKWYDWSRTFYDSINPMNLLVAGNQLGKSVSLQRKWVNWSTNRKIWPNIWPNHRPRQFWFCYPTRDVATVEWKMKIEPDIMPRGDFKNHPIYGWQVEFEKKLIHSVHFNSGVTTYFKSYNQDVHALQSSSPDSLFIDEELPEELFSELQARLFHTGGPFNMVFTATRGQLLWLQAMEGKDSEEKFPDALKLQVSMWDCQTYTDGTPGAYSAEKIKRIISSCRSPQEVLRRVYGKFVKESGRIVSEFDPLAHFMTPRPIPPSWTFLVSAIDHGSGGENHPAAFLFLAVSPDFKEGWITDGWRGDDVITTPGDVLEKWQAARGPRRPAITVYDWAAGDLAIIGARMGLPLVKAEKSQELGEDMLNTLYKNNMLKVFDTPELRKLGTEYLTVMKETPKRKRKDDLSDCSRFAVVAVPWDWTATQASESEEALAVRKKKGEWSEKDQRDWELKQRRGETRSREEEDDGYDPMSAELEYWDQFYGN